MTAIIKPINRVLSLILIICICFCMCFCPIAKAEVATTIITLVSIGVTLLNIFGWTTYGWDEASLSLSNFWDNLSDGASACWHSIIGDYAIWYLSEYGELSDELIAEGYSLDDNGDLISPDYENPIDAHFYFENGEVKFVMPSSVYSDIWYEVQRYMHSPTVTLNNYVQVVDDEPTLEELRNSRQVLYVGYYNSETCKFSFDDTADWFTPNGCTVRNISLNYRASIGFLNSNKYIYLSWFLSSLEELSSSDNIGISSFYYIKNGDKYNLRHYLFSYNHDYIIPGDIDISLNSYGGMFFSSSSLYSRPNEFDRRIDEMSVIVSDPVKDNVSANAYAGTVTKPNENGDDVTVPVTAPGQAQGNITIGSGDVSGTLTNPVTGVKGSDYTQGKADTLTGTVTATASITDSAVSDVAVTSTATMDFPNGFDKFKPSIALFEKFPFCIPYDLYMCFAIFYEEPKPLIFDVPIKSEAWGIDTGIHIDLTEYDYIFVLFRYFTLLGFIIFLILKTRDLIKG